MPSSFPYRARRIFSVVIAGAGFITSGALAVVVFDRSPQQTLLIAESMSRDRLAALTQVLVAGFGLAAVLVSWGDRRRDHVGEYYALLAAAGGGMAFFVSAGNLMTLFLGLEWFSISLYILVAMDTHRKESLEAGLKYLIVGSFGSAILLFGSALTYGATGELGFNAIRTATGADDSLFVAGMAMIIAGLAFKASAAPFHMWTPDVYEGAPTPVTAFMSAATKAVALVVTLRDPRDGVPGAVRDLVDRDRRARRDLARDRQPRRPGATERQAAARLLVRLAGRLHADRDRGRQRARRQGAALLPRSPTARPRSAPSPSSRRASASSAER